MPRPRTYRVEAVVLRRVDFGEADRVLVLYTRERGKVPVVAKGVRRMSSRMVRGSSFTRSWPRVSESSRASAIHSPIRSGPSAGDIRA